MSKNTKIVSVSAAVLLVIVAVTAFLNADSLTAKRAMQDAAVFHIIAGEETVAVSMADVESLSPREITANYKKSGKEPEDHSYTVVPLAEIFALKNIDTTAFSAVSFTAADGYASAVSMAEASDPALCCIAVAEAGVPLGKREDGGSGPFMMILPEDQFSQRWCKFLMEVRLNP